MSLLFPTKKPESQAAHPYERKVIEEEVRLQTKPLLQPAPIGVESDSTKIELPKTVASVVADTGSFVRKPTPIVRTPEPINQKEYEQHPNKKFMATMPRFEPIAKDHTSIIVLKTCPRKYFYQIVLGMVSKEKNIIFLPWGSAYHLFRQRLSEHYGYGDNTPVPFDDKKAQVAFSKAASEAVMYWKKYGKDQAVGSQYDWFTTERFIKSCNTAYKYWVGERKRGLIKVIAVEQPFVVQLKDGSFTSGRADEVVLWNNNIWGRDFKTTSKEQKWFQRALIPNDQIRRYVFSEGKLAGKPVKGIIIEAMFNSNTTKSKGEKGPDIYECSIECAQSEIDSWEQDQTIVNKTLALYREHDTWPQYEVHCPFCPYHLVCQKTTESAQQWKLEEMFVCKPWDPADINDD